MRIHKCDHHGQPRVSYDGELIAYYGPRITLHARWTLPARTLPYVTLEPGDVFIETFYTDRWYNVFEIHWPDGTLIRRHLPARPPGGRRAELGRPGDRHPDGHRRDDAGPRPRRVRAGIVRIATGRGSQRPGCRRRRARRTEGTLAELR
jgi:hypothetical protein